MLVGGAVLPGDTVPVDVGGTVAVPIELGDGDGLDGWAVLAKIVATVVGRAGGRRCAIVGQCGLTNLRLFSRNQLP